MTALDTSADHRAADAEPLSVGIIGGGASGALLAARLLRDAIRPVRVVVFEPRPTLGEGVAYATADPVHLLNVPACGMSALPEDMDHFRRWAGCEDTDFLPRIRYAEYLCFVLDEAEHNAVSGSSLVHVQQTVVDLGLSPRPWVSMDDGTTTSFDSLVLATGHTLPAVLPQVEDLARRSPGFIENPWAPDGLDGIGPGDEVLIIGTGLTSVDVSLSILSRVEDAQLHAVSRHGLLPLAHEDPWRPRLPAPDIDLDDVDVIGIASYIRSHGDDWRRAVDSLRPLSADIWLGMDDSARSGFLRHLSRYWGIHRHRMAPQIARAFGSHLDSGSIRVHQASILGIRLDGDRLVTSLSDGTVLATDHVVLCTGPSGDLREEPLAGLLMSRGTARPGPSGTGYLVDAVTGAVITSEGVADNRLLTLGPLRLGVLWESLAMPEIRVQAADAAELVLSGGTGAVPGSEAPARRV